MMDSQNVQTTEEFEKMEITSSYDKLDPSPYDKLDPAELEVLMLRGRHMPPCFRKWLKDQKALPDVLVALLENLGPNCLKLEALEATIHQNQAGIPQSQAAIPQCQALAGQICNNAGGYVYKVDDICTVKRAVILDSPKSTYYTQYTQKREIEEDSLQIVDDIIKKGNGKSLVEEMLKIAKGRRAAKRRMLNFVLAKCARHKSTKKQVFENLSTFCNIPTDLFEFVHFYSNLKFTQDDKTAFKKKQKKTTKKSKKGSRSRRGKGRGTKTQKTTVESKKGSLADPDKGQGWGRASRKGFSGWYLKFKHPQDAAEDQQRNKTDKEGTLYDLAHYVTKYRRVGEHKNLLRKVHLNPKCYSNKRSDLTYFNYVLKYVVHGWKKAEEFREKNNAALCETSNPNDKKVVDYFKDVEDLKQAPDNADGKQLAIDLIKKHRFERECVPDYLRKYPEIWRTLLEDMPIEAMLKNLGQMQSNGTFEDKSALEKVVAELKNEKKITGSKIHPFKVLTAWYQYKEGKGNKGKKEWTPDKHIKDALEVTFDISSKVKKFATGKRMCLAIDVSSSMDWSEIMGTSITAREAAAAMAMVSLRTEDPQDPEDPDKVSIVAFNHKMTKLKITKDSNLEAVITEMKNHRFGATDCAQPMLWAAENKKKFDVFVVYTDNETYYGAIHPSEALRQYRAQMKIYNAKLIVVAMTATDFSIADPDDPNMLDIVGFDSNAPYAMQQFIREGEPCKDDME